MINPDKLCVTNFVFKLIGMIGIRRVPGKSGHLLGLFPGIQGHTKTVVDWSLIWVQTRQLLKILTSWPIIQMWLSSVHLYFSCIFSCLKCDKPGFFRCFRQARKIYVQHKIVEAGEAVHQCMLKQEGHFYVCGSARQVPEDIYTAMKEVPRIRKWTKELVSEFVGLLFTGSFSQNIGVEIIR